MEKKICVAVPTFPGHYLYALDFMKSFIEYQYDQQADLFFIFTTPEERDGFMPCNSIVLPESLRIMKNRGIINIKKFYALMQLKEQYEYIFVLDDEALFCKTVDLYTICRSFFERKILYGNIVENPKWDFHRIVPEHCKKFFNKEIWKSLNCPLYLWFNQIPVYRTSDLKKFFKMTNMGRRIHNLTYYDFDYYIYMFYLIAQGGFDVMDIGIISSCSVAEITSATPWSFTGKAETEHIFMATQYISDCLHAKNVFLVCHRDCDVAEAGKKNKFAKLICAFKRYHKVKRLLS